MKFYSIRDLRTETKEICDYVRSGGEAVITNNGKPAVLMLDISSNDFELIIRSVRQAKAMVAFNAMRGIAAESGYMTDEEIDAEIRASRMERRAGGQK